MMAVVVSQAEEDLMASENLLKIIEKKIFKWIKKCRKHGGCLFDDVRNKTRILIKLNSFLY